MLAVLHLLVEVVAVDMVFLPCSCHLLYLFLSMKAFL